jgi:SAM-dependent methyltransferase
MNFGVKYVKQISYDYDFRKILDIGCSQGMAVKEYEKYHKEAYGIDPAQFPILYAQKQLNLNCQIASVLDIPYGTNFFDTSVLTYTLEYIFDKDLERAVDEILRVTKKHIIIKIGEKVLNDKDLLKNLRKKTEDFKNITSLRNSNCTKESVMKKFQSSSFLTPNHTIVFLER